MLVFAVPFTLRGKKDCSQIENSSSFIFYEFQKDVRLISVVVFFSFLQPHINTNTIVLQFVVRNVLKSVDVRIILS